MKLRSPRNVKYYQSSKLYNLVNAKRRKRGIGVKTLKRKLVAEARIYVTSHSVEKRKKKVRKSLNKSLSLDYVRCHLRARKVEKENVDKVNEMVFVELPCLNAIASGLEWWKSIAVECLEDIEEWVEDNRLPEEGANLTRGTICKHLKQNYNIVTSLRQVSSLLHYFGYKWSKLKNGYFIKKMSEPKVINHRIELIPFLEYVEDCDKFVVLYFDESQMRMNLYEGWGWTKTVRGSNIDRRMMSGKGFGFRVSAFLRCVNGKCSVLRYQNGKFIGNCASTAMKKKNGKMVKADSDTHTSFLATIRKGILEQMKQTPDKKVVLLVDGARTHTTFSSHAKKPYTTMNMYKPTEKKPHTLKGELQKLDLWPKDGVVMKEAAKLFEKTPTYLSQRCEFEELCEELGCIGIFLPNSHPILNPIERLWRGIKEQFRREAVKSLEALKKVILNNLNVGYLDSHIKGWIQRSARYRRFFAQHPSCTYPPSECQIRSNKYNYLDTFCISTSTMSSMNSLEFSNYSHWLNTARSLGCDLKFEQSLLTRLDCPVKDTFG